MISPSLTGLDDDQSMILKGSQRGGGPQLAAHLMNAFDNERVEHVEVRGAVAQDLSGAFAEWSAQGRATKIVDKYFYHLCISPDPAQGGLTREQYFDLLDRIDRSLNLVGQPRAVVFHEKRDDQGVLRHHGHAVWSRVDTRGPKVKAVNIAHDNLKLQTVIRHFCRDHRLNLPPGMAKQDAARDAFNARAEDLGEWQQKERSGITKEERMAVIGVCWTATSNGAAFVRAMEEKGYHLAQGDSREYVVVDLRGDVHSLSRQLSGIVRAKGLRERLSDYPPNKQPGVDETIKSVERKRKLAVMRTVTPKENDPISAAEQRSKEHEEFQKQRRATLDHMQANLLDRHAMESDQLKAIQRAQNEGVASTRLRNQPQGVMGFLARVTGIQLVIDVRHRQQDKTRTAFHKAQNMALQQTHAREQCEMDRHYHDLDRLEARENRSAEITLRRAQFQVLLQRKPPQPALKPEFDNAASAQRATGMADGKGLSAAFGQSAADNQRRGELRAAFERAASGKEAAKGDTDAAARAPDTETTDQARQLRDQLRGRQPRRGPGTDRDRER